MLGKELIVGGRFVNWVGDNPVGWDVTGEVGSDPEISEVDAGQGHGGTNVTGGYCNLYTSDGTEVRIHQGFIAVIGRKYRLSIKIDKVTSGHIRITENRVSDWTTQILTSVGTYSWTYVATVINPVINVRRGLVEATDVTFDDVSIREDIPTGLSRTGHSFASRQEI